LRRERDSSSGAFSTQVPTRLGPERAYSPGVALLLSWASNVFALWVASLAFEDITYDDSVWVLVVAGLVFGLVNLVVRPIVILLALPAVILTLGIALLFVNAFMLYLTDKIVPPFEVEGFWTIVGGALIIWIVNLVVSTVIEPEKRVRDVRRALGRQ
jgi:putative membrane protein